MAARYQPSDRVRLRKPGPGDLPAAQLVGERLRQRGPDLRGDLPRGRAERRRQQHRDVGRVVALALALGALDFGLRGWLAVSALDRHRHRLHGGRSSQHGRAERGTGPMSRAPGPVVPRLTGSLTHRPAGG